MLSPLMIFPLCLPCPPQNNELSIPLSEVEIKSVIAQLRSGKEPGIERISLEMISLGKDVTTH